MHNLTAQKCSKESQSSFTTTKINKNNVSMIYFHCKQFPKPIAFCSLLFWLSAELGHLIIIMFLIILLCFVFRSNSLYTARDTQRINLSKNVEMPIFKFCKPQNGLATKTRENIQENEIQISFNKKMEELFSIFLNYLVPMSCSENFCAFMLLD